jgi:tubulin-specific chaperone A
MPAPSPLAIATSVLNRLVKEEVSYHKELEQQNAKIAKLEAGEGADDQNADFILRQQVCIVVVTREIRLYEFLRAS